MGGSLRSFFKIDVKCRGEDLDIRQELLPHFKCQMIRTIERSDISAAVRPAAGETQTLPGE